MITKKSRYYENDMNKYLQKVVDDTLAKCTRHLTGPIRMNLWGAADEKCYPIRITIEGSLTLLLHLRADETNADDIRNYILAYDATNDHEQAKKYMEKCRCLSSPIPPRSPPVDCTNPKWLLRIARIIHDVTGITPVKGWELWLMHDTESPTKQKTLITSSIRRIGVVIPKTKPIDISTLICQIAVGMGSLDPMVIDIAFAFPDVAKDGRLRTDDPDACIKQIKTTAYDLAHKMKKHIIWRD